MPQLFVGHLGKNLLRQFSQEIDSVSAYGQYMEEEKQKGKRQHASGSSIDGGQQKRYKVSGDSSSSASDMVTEAPKKQFSIPKIPHIRQVSEVFSVEEEALAATRMISFFDRYVRGKELGKGSFGKCYETTRIDDGEMFCMKMIPKSLLNEKNLRATKFETLMLKELNHPHITNLHDFHQDQHFFYLIMDLCSGGDLFDFVDQWNNRAGGVPEHIARDIFRAIADAVAYCHANGVVHRDIKPENVMMTTGSNATVKLGDFGFAAKVDARWKHKQDSLKSSLGTLGYMAPETIVTRENYGPKADVWSLGVMLFVMVAGYPPFFGNNDFEMKQKIVSGDFSFDQRWWGDKSKEVQDLIAKILVKDPKQRISLDTLLRHDWVWGSRTQQHERDLSPQLKHIKKHMARKKLKAILNLGRVASAFAGEGRKRGTGMNFQMSSEASSASTISPTHSAGGPLPAKGIFAQGLQQWNF